MFWTTDYCCLLIKKNDTQNKTQLSVCLVLRFTNCALKYVSVCLQFFIQYCWLKSSLWSAMPSGFVLIPVIVHLLLCIWLFLFIFIILFIFNDSGLLHSLWILFGCWCSHSPFQLQRSFVYLTRQMPPKSKWVILLAVAMEWHTGTEHTAHVGLHVFSCLTSGTASHFASVH